MGENVGFAIVQCVRYTGDMRRGRCGRGRETNSKTRRRKMPILHASVVLKTKGKRLGRMWRRESAPCPHQIDASGKKSNDVATEITGGGRRSEEKAWKVRTTTEKAKVGNTRRRALVTCEHHRIETVQ